MPLLDLRQRRIERAAARCAGREVLGLLTLEQEGLPRELASSLDLGAGRRLRRFRGRLGRVSHLRLSDPPLPATRGMARRIWPDQGGHPKYGFSAPGSPWVQELNGPVRIKALLIPQTYSLSMKFNSSARRPLRALIALAGVLAVLSVAGCATSGGGKPDSRLTAEQAKTPIPGAPPQLAAIRSQANQLLGGGKDAFDARLAQLRGIPVVVNKW